MAKISNQGIRVIISTSTHSDYFIRELNNLIMLNNYFPEKEKITEKYGYSEDMFLNIDKIGVYLFDNNEIVHLDNDKEGFSVTTFDN